MSIVNKELPCEIRVGSEALEADEARGAGLSARSGARDEMAAELDSARLAWLIHWVPENGPH